jgi:hypothetical protein
LGNRFFGLELYAKALCLYSGQECDTVFENLKCEDRSMKITIQNGCEADAPAAISVLHHSISQLCVADHRGDKNEITDWLSNKTEQV